MHDQKNGYGNPTIIGMDHAAPARAPSLPPLPHRSPHVEKLEFLRRLVWERETDPIVILGTVRDVLERQELIAQAIGTLGSLCEAWRGSSHRWFHKARMRQLVALLSRELV